MMRSLRERFDVVVIDAPPALQVTDAAVLAGKCDATMIVARGDITRRSELAATVEMLRPSAKLMIGLALNADANVPGGGFFGFRVSEPNRRRAAVRA
jgi:Mrp family chromosome partitioning ATPase